MNITKIAVPVLETNTESELQLFAFKIVHGTTEAYSKQDHLPILQ